MGHDNTVPRRFTWLLRDTLARIAIVRESLEVGAIDEADGVLCDLEIDLEAELGRLDERRAA